MFDIGATELLVLAVVAIIVVGPKDLPRLLRQVGQWISKAKGMAREFQSHFEDAARDTGLEDIRHDLLEMEDSGPVADLTGSFDDLKKSIEAPVAKKRKAKKPRTGAKKTASRANGSVTASKPPVKSRKKTAARKKAKSPGRTAARRASGK